MVLMQFKNKPAIIITGIRILVGAVFIFSGFVKLDDPLGFSYKLEEYCEVFGISSLSRFSLFFSILFSSLEIIFGFALWIGFKIRQVIPLLLALVLFFTFLTLYSAYYNKVTECGCFGDAVKLTPWQSFYKNLVLTFLILVLTFNQKNIAPFWNSMALRIGMGFIISLTLAFGLYSYWYLPLIDFLPYKVGKNLPSQMEIPKGVAGDEFSIDFTLKNLKTGEIKRIANQDYIRTKIYENSAWKFLRASEPVLINSGYQIPIKDLKITDSLGLDHTDSLIKSPGYSVIIVEYKLTESNLSAQNKIVDLVKSLQNKKIQIYGITSNSSVEAKKILNPYSINYPIYFCDAIPLKSMVRSNPGIVLLHNGTVLEKWSSHHIPNEVEISNFLKNQP